MHLSKIIPLMLLAVLLLMLPACDEKAEDPTRGGQNDGATSGNMMYQFDYLDPRTDEGDYQIDESNSCIHFANTWDNRLCITIGHIGITSDGNKNHQQIFTAYNTDTGSFEKLNINNVVDIEYNIKYIFRAVAPTPDGGYVAMADKSVARIPVDELDTFVEPDYHPQLMKFNSDGSYTVLADLQELFPDTDIYTTLTTPMLVDKDGYIFFYNRIIFVNGTKHLEVTDEWVTVVSPDGENLFTLGAPDGADEFMDAYMRLGGDGELLLECYDEIGTNLVSMYFTIDIENRCYKEVTDIPVISIDSSNLVKNNKYALLGEGRDIYYYDRTGLFGQNFGEDEELLFEWKDIGLPFDCLKNVLICSDELIFVRIQDPDDGSVRYGKIALVPVSSVYGEELSEPITLRLAVDEENNPGVSELLKYAAGFVRRGGCRVEIISYSDTEGGLTANQKLARDISAGNAPDLVLVGGGLTYETLAKSGAFADIYGFIDGDADYSRSDFLPCVLEPFETSEGQLQRLVTEFDIRTITANKSLVGSERLTLDALEDFGKSLGEDQYLFSVNFVSGSKASLALLKNLLPCMMGEFVDFEKGECESSALSGLLRLCRDANLCTSYGFADAGMLNEGTLLFNQAFYSNIGYFLLDRYCNFPAGEIAYIGYPTVGESGGNHVVYPSISASIIKQSGSQELAWNLIKYFIRMKEDGIASTSEPKDINRLNNFPCTYNGIEQLIGLARSCRFVIRSGGVYEDPVTKEESYINSINVTALPEDESERYNKATAEGYEIYFDDGDASALYALFENATRAYISDSATRAIIIEEASSYFAGVKSLEETLKLIQSRLEIRLAE